MSHIINRKKFFDTVRFDLFGGKLTDPQVEGLIAIITEFEHRALPDIRWMAYILATAYHETGRKMVPVEENLNYSAQGLANTFPRRCAVFPRDERKLPNSRAREIARRPIAIANYVYANKNGNGNEESGDGWKYRGMGLAQTTGRANYKKFGSENNPEKMLELNFSVSSMFKGMIEGLYTGVALLDCFNKTKDQPIKARTIINGTDKAESIANYHRQFLTALSIS